MLVPLSSSSSKRGATLIEVLVVVTILTVGTGFLADTLISISRLNPVREQTDLSVRTGRAMAERLRAIPHDEVFATYDADPANDPNGVGTAPGSHFDVEGLSAREGDADGRVGRIVFPVIGAELREDLIDAALGFPRDLNGDGVVDNLDHSTDYSLLPVAIELAWEANGRDRTETFYLVLADS